MNLEEDYIKLIFGLKIKQVRADRELSLYALSKKSGLSKSYLNEIEKGKKYPKTDKIIALSEALETSYDELVSLKLDKNLAPVGELFQSNILKEIPLDHFGIRQQDLIDIIAEAPLKVNTFINTLIEIAKYYNLNKENFFLVALRSFQESRNNYFPDLETSVSYFKQQYLSFISDEITSRDLEDLLIEEYGYTIDVLDVESHSNLKEIRSIFSRDTKTLFISSQIENSQKLFLLAKEIGFNFLKHEKRPLTFSWIKYNSFEEVLNNFYASYFAGAFLIPEKTITQKLKTLFGQTSYSNDDFISIMNSFPVSSETFFQRLTNILPGKFGIRNLFFLRFTSPADRLEVKLSKELHITNLHEPHAKKTDEHYCRRWMSSKLLQDFPLASQNSKVDAQISNYHSTQKSYFVISAASEDPFKTNIIRSIGLGILLHPNNSKAIKFLNTPSITSEQVGVTCETCAIENCEVRAKPASTLEEDLKNRASEIALESFLKSATDGQIQTKQE